MGDAWIRFSPEERRSLAAYAASARWPAGFMVYQRGVPADGVFVVLNGHVVLRTRLKGGRAFVPAIVAAGEPFGTEGLTSGAVYQTDARADVESQTLHLSRSRLQTMLRERPALGLSLLAQVGRTQAVLLDRLRELAALSVEQRLLAAVARAARARGDGRADAPVVFDAAGYRLLCEMVGATRESVSLVVNRLVADGLAAREGTGVSIRPPRGFLGSADLLLGDDTLGAGEEQVAF